MLNVQFMSIGTFKDILDAISNLLSEGTFVIDEKGIHFKATDPTMVTLIEMFYGKENFDIYEVEDKVYLTLNIDLLRQSLKKTKASDKVIFQINEKNISRLNVIIKGKHEKRFVLPILDSEVQEIPELNLEFKGSAEILSSLFVEAIEDASNISDEATFSFENGAFTISAQSELTSMEAEFKKESEGVIALDAKEDVKAKYSIDYLKKITKAKKVAPTVKISINQDAPARFDFKDSDDLWMYYILAPRAEE